MNILSAEPVDEDDTFEVTIVLGMKKSEWNRVAHTRRALWNSAGLTLH